LLDEIAIFSPRLTLKVGGHVAANFFLHNLLSTLVLRRRSRVGGQLADTQGKVGGHVAANFFLHNLLSTLVLRRRSRVGGQLADTTGKVAGHVAANLVWARAGLWGCGCV